MTLVSNFVKFTGGTVEGLEKARKYKPILLYKPWVRHHEEEHKEEADPALGWITINQVHVHLDKDGLIDKGPEGLKALNHGKVAQKYSRSKGQGTHKKALTEMGWQHNKDADKDSEHGHHQFFTHPDDNTIKARVYTRFNDSRQTTTLTAPLKYHAQMQNAGFTTARAKKKAEAA
jgi:hypothetical protein